MPPRQLAFDLPARAALGRSDFLVAPANRIALGLVDRWPDWPERKLALAGPEGSGKTHLVHVWAARARARIVPATALTRLDLGEMSEAAAVAVEDCDRLPALGRDAEEALFHLHNRLALGGGTLMVTGVAAPAQWGLVLPDLESRLAAATLATLEPPDDALLAAVLVKLFADRQLEVSPGLIEYLLPRIERSFAGACAVVARLDRLALARRRAVTQRLAAEALGAAGGGGAAAPSSTQHPG
jgi:chromosomal replication initiation ATPase DnaA